MVWWTMFMLALGTPFAASRLLSLRVASPSSSYWPCAKVHETSIEESVPPKPAA